MTWHLSIGHYMHEISTVKDLGFRVQGLGLQECSFGYGHFGGGFYCTYPPICGPCESRNVN